MWLRCTGPCVLEEPVLPNVKRLWTLCREQDLEQRTIVAMLTGLIATILLSPMHIVCLNNIHIFDSLYIHNQSNVYSLRTIEYVHITQNSKLWFIPILYYTKYEYGHISIIELADW